MPTSSRQITFGGKLCLAWNPAYAPGQGQATSYFNPRGPEPGVGYVWMLSSDAIQLDFDVPLELAISTVTNGAGASVAFPRLYVEHAIACSGGFSGDVNRAYLLTLRDSRFLLAEMTAINAQFNVRVPAAPTLSTDGADPDEFYFDSLDTQTGDPYTWDSAAAWIWESLPASIVGAYPGLPIEPEGIPQNLRYQGVSAWHALHDVLGRVQLTTVYDPQADKFFIVDLAAIQPGFENAMTANAAVILNDRAPRASVRARMPSMVRVYFHKQAQHFGTERDTPVVENWVDEGALYEVDVPTGAAAEPGTVVRLFDDEPAIVDYAGDVLNETELEGRATQRAQQWIAAKTIQIPRTSIIYQGVIGAFAVPGSQVSAVLYRDYGDGTMTEILLSPDPPARTGAAPAASKGSGAGCHDENFAPPDFARRTFPVYPRELQLVQVTNANKNGAGIYQGVVVRLNPAGDFSAATMPLEEIEPCALADSSPNAPPAVVGSIHHGRINGVASVTSIAGELPLYILDEAPAIQVAKLTADIDHNKSGAADLYSGVPGQETDTGQNITVFNRFTPALSGEFVLVYQPAGQSLYLLVNDQYQGRLLGQTNENIKNGEKGVVNIYSGSLGIETALIVGTTSVKAINKWAGDVRKGQWVWLNSDGDGWYIVSAQSGQALLGQVQAGQAATNTGQCAVGTTIRVEIYSATVPDPADTSITVNANVIFAPLLEKEWVWVEWEGGQFVVTKGELDGGFFATAFNDMPKGGTGRVSVNYDGGRISIIDGLLVVQNNPLGLVPNGKQVFITRNRTGLGTTAAEC